MDIAFWSEADRSGTTAGMHVISTVCSKMYEEELMWENMEQRRPRRMHFLDCGSSCNRKVQERLQRADLVVLNIRNSMERVPYYESFFHGEERHIFYLINRYEGKDVVKGNRRLLGIQEERVGVIPEWKIFQNAANGGRASEFVRKYYNCGKDNENYAFIQEAKRSAEKIMLLAARQETEQKAMIQVKAACMAYHVDSLLWQKEEPAQQYRLY